MSNYDDIDEIEYPAEDANADGATVMQARVDMQTTVVMCEPDGRLVLEDVDTKASPQATRRMAHVAVCEACTLEVALRPVCIVEPQPWQVIKPNAGMLENLVAEVPSSMAGGMFREVWACSDACERALLKWAGLDPTTAGLKSETPT